MSGFNGGGFLDRRVRLFFEEDFFFFFLDLVEDVM